MSYFDSQLVRLEHSVGSCTYKLSLIGGLLFQFSGNLLDLAIKIFQSLDRAPCPPTAGQFDTSDTRQLVYT